MAGKVWRGMENARTKGGVTMVYQWKSCSQIRANANEAGAQFEKLESTVGLSAQSVLDANRPEDAPLHDEFEWDDEKAAEEYRLSQARFLLRMICVKQDSSEQRAPIRAFFKVSYGSNYESVETILTERDKHADLIATAYAELQAFRNKYQMLSELEPIFSEIEKLKGA